MDRGRKLVSRAYRKISQLTLDSLLVMTQTALQLFNINNATLTKWYNNRMKVTIGLDFVLILMCYTVIYLYVQVTRTTYTLVCVYVQSNEEFIRMPKCLQRNHCHHQYAGCRSRSYHPYIMRTSSPVPCALLAESSRQAAPSTAQD